MVAGSIVIMAFDNLTEQHQEFATREKLGEVIALLRKNKFDPRVIARLEKYGGKQLAEVRAAMEAKKEVFTQGNKSEYFDVATKSNGIQYLAALFLGSTQTLPSYIDDINLALRLIVDSASLEKDHREETPNVILKRTQPENPCRLSLQDALQNERARVEALVAIIDEKVHKGGFLMLESYFFHMLQETKSLMENAVIGRLIKRSQQKILGKSE